MEHRKGTGCGETKKPSRSHEQHPRPKKTRPENNGINKPTRQKGIGNEQERPTIAKGQQRTKSIMREGGKDHLRKGGGPEPGGGKLTFGQGGSVGGSYLAKKGEERQGHQRQIQRTMVQLKQAT